MSNLSKEAIEKPAEPKPKYVASKYVEELEPYLESMDEEQRALVERMITQMENNNPLNVIEFLAAFNPQKGPTWREAGFDPTKQFPDGSRRLNPAQAALRVALIHFLCGLERPKEPIEVITRIRNYISIAPPAHLWTKRETIVRKHKGKVVDKIENSCVAIIVKTESGEASISVGYVLWGFELEVCLPGEKKWSMYVEANQRGFLKRLLFELEVGENNPANIESAREILVHFFDYMQKPKPEQEPKIVLGIRAEAELSRFGAHPISVFREFLKHISLQV